MKKKTSCSNEEEAKVLLWKRGRGVLMKMKPRCSYEDEDKVL